MQPLGCFSSPGKTQKNISSMPNTSVGQLDHVSNAWVGPKMASAFLFVFLSTTPQGTNPTRDVDPFGDCLTGQEPGEWPPNAWRRENQEHFPVWALEVRRRNNTHV